MNITLLRCPLPGNWSRGRIRATMPRFAAAQMTSSNNLEKNLEVMESLIQQAAKEEVDWICFPEMAYFQGPRSEWIPLLKDYNPLLERFAGWAQKYQVHLIPGTLREPHPKSSDHCFNTLVAFDDRGRPLGKYRKIFLFKATLKDRVYDESDYCGAGEETCLFQSRGMSLGVGICYDLRFPEMFRRLRKKGTQVLILPSSFTYETGKAHWDTLTRTRAIENQVFFVAPNQFGILGEKSHAYGHSRILSPWGDVLCEVSEGQGLAIAELDPRELEIARSRLDCWASRREDLFPIE